MNDKQQAAQTAQPLTRRERKAAATRRALFEAGLEAFGRQPIGWVSVVDLTEAVDVAKGVFYLHFKSKDEFLIALYRDVLNQFLDGVDNALASASPRTSRTGRIRRIAQQYFDFAHTDTAAARFLMRMSGYFPDEIGPPEEFVNVRVEYRDRLAATFSPFGALPPNDGSRHVAMVLDGCCWGIIGGALQIGTPLPDKRVFSQIAAAAARCAGDETAKLVKDRP